MAHILLIDDNDALRDMLHAALEKRGHTIIGARDGQEGLKYFSEGKFDAVVTEMIMPRMDGIELIIALRRLNAGARIIVISGGGRVITVEYCLEIANKLGVRQVLKKPFAIHTLEACIASELA